MIIYNAASNVAVQAFHDFLGLFGIKNLVALEVQSWPVWAHLLVGFVFRDFIQWWVHRLLHRVPFLWEFHKVHHSVKQLGFAAHLRYHWMETLECQPDCEIQRAKIDEVDPVGFIAVPAPHPADFEVVNGY